MRFLRHVCGWGIALLALTSVATRASAVTIGVMGDSLSDEYSENFPPAANGQNWVEQLAQYRAVNFGPTAAAAGQPSGTWGDPRNRGFEYNWAEYGARTTNLLADGQHTGLASQVASKGIQYGILAIGANDLIYSDSNYENIYNGTWTPAEIAAFRTGVVSRITTAMDTVRATGLKMVLVDVPDYNVTPAAVSARPDASKRDRVTAVVTAINNDLKAYAEDANLPLVDLQAAATAMFGTNSALKSTLKIGNVNINLRLSDIPPLVSRPTAGFLGDQIHIATPLQGILANLMVTALNDRYNAGITPFTEQELLAHRGIAYGGSNTLQGQIGPYSNYVVLNVPEPSTAAAGAGGRRRNGRCGALAPANSGTLGAHERWISLMRSRRSNLLR